MNIAPLTLLGFEVRKIPHEFANEPVELTQLIECLKMFAKQRRLVFLRPYVGRQLYKEPMKHFVFFQC